MRDEAKPFPSGGVTFTFAGGPRDGQSVGATVPPTDREMDHAHGLWLVTEGGTVGRQFSQSPPAYWDAPHLHKYEVVGKAERLTGVVVECVYREA